MKKEDLKFDHAKTNIAEAMGIDLEVYTAKLKKMEQDLKINEDGILVLSTKRFDYIHENFELKEIFFMLYLVEDRYYQLMDIIGFANHLYQQRQQQLIAGQSKNIQGLSAIKGGKPITEA